MRHANLWLKFAIRFVVVGVYSLYLSTEIINGLEKWLIKPLTIPFSAVGIGRVCNITGGCRIC